MLGLIVLDRIGENTHPITQLLFITPNNRYYLLPSCQSSTESENRQKPHPNFQVYGTLHFCYQVLAFWKPLFHYAGGHEVKDYE